MKRIAMGVLAVAVVFVAGAARADGAGAIFEKKCAPCHGKDGKGQTKMGEKMGVKDLATSAATAADLEKTIADGRGKMPAFKGKVSDEEIKAIAAFVKAGLK
jgi:cytochrome c6